MNHRMIAVWLAVLVAASASAQYGGAPNGYYPPTYTGATFTGTVTEGKGDAVTLTYTKKDKTQTFTGQLETSCAMPTRDGQPMSASDLTPGTVLTAFYNKESRKVDGRKEPVNLIVAIMVNVWQGQPIPENKRKIYLCTPNKQLQFRAWSNQ